MMRLIGKQSRKNKIINNIIMKKIEYCRPETVSLEAVAENILCVSEVMLEGNEKFEFGEIEW